MKLFHTQTSPFVRKVMLAAHELGLAQRIETVYLRPSPQAPDPELSRHNPLSKIPALVTDDGETLYDSVVIVDYLESVAAADDAPRLTPLGPARWPVLRTQALCDGILEAGILVFYERAQRPPQLHWQPWLDGQSAKVLQGLDALEADHDLTRDPTTASPNLAHLCLGATLGWLDFRRPVGDFREGRARLAAWFEAFAQRPSMVATHPS